MVFFQHIDFQKVKNFGIPYLIFAVVSQVMNFRPRHFSAVRISPAVGVSRRLMEPEKVDFPLPELSDNGNNFA